MTDLKQLAERLEKEGIDVLHVGLFDYASSFRERRLRRDQFLAWARDPRFSNTLPYWDNSDNLFGGGPYLTEALKLDFASLRPYGFEPNAATIIACILERAGHINSAGGYLRDLTRRAERGEFALGPMVMALVRANAEPSKRAG